MAYVRSNKASWEASKNNFAGGLAGLVDIGSRIYEAEKSALDAKDDLAARNYVTKMSGDYDIVMTKSLESEDPTKWLY